MIICEKQSRIIVIYLQIWPKLARACNLSTVQSQLLSLWITWYIYYFREWWKKYFTFFSQKKVIYEYFPWKNNFHNYKLKESSSFYKQKIFFDFWYFHFSVCTWNIAKNIFIIFPLKNFWQFQTERVSLFFASEKNPILPKVRLLYCDFLPFKSLSHYIKVRFHQKRCYCHILKQINIIFSWTWKFEFWWLKAA